MNAETCIVPALGHTLNQILPFAMQKLLSALSQGGELESPEVFPQLPVLPS